MQENDREIACRAAEEVVERRGARPRFDPTINLGHILTFVGFLATIAIGWSSLDKRVLVLEEGRKAQELVDRAQDDRGNQLRAEIRESLVDIKRSVERMNDQLQQRK